MFNDRKIYLENEIKPIMEDITHKLAVDLPDNPTEYILEYLVSYLGYKDNELSKEEKEELIELRKKVNSQRLEEEKENPSLSDEEMNNINLNELNLNPAKKINRKHRIGVSAEVYGKLNKREDFVPKFITKTESQMERIKSKILTSFLFRNLEKQDLDIIIGAMEEKSYKIGEYVIEQNDNGDCLYIVETGELDCYKLFSNNPEKVFLKKYLSGDSFGELALLYNTPRAASIITINDCILWSLDRATFNNIIKDSARKKREKYQKFLKSVEILSTVDEYELCQICDALKLYHFKAGEYVIREVENSFFYF